ncbi:MAG TPA: serine/threonine-protein kinase [Acidimicrobiia bacterium]|jgi:serine/threonine-protein kinase
MEAPQRTSLAGRYELGETIGRGGMADVRAATDTRLGRDVAVKLLRADLAARADARRRFDAEARAAARLTHPNIVVVYDCGEDLDVPFLVMERLPGDTLAGELADGPVTVERARAVGVAILAALAHAHRHGVIHRDVKPANVLLAADGTPKVADFGIAKTAEDDTGTLTLTGELVATPAYLAPERIRDAPATFASDLYAVGVVLYEALAGRRPFTGDSPVAVLDAVLRDDAPRLVQLRPDVPRDVAAVVERAMAHDPVERFTSAEEMAAALEQEPVEEPPTVPMAPGPRTEVISPAAARTVSPRPLPARAQPATRRALRSHRPRRWIVALAALVVLVALAVGVVAAVSGDGGGPATPVVQTQPPSTTPSPLPAPLEHAVTQLEQSVSR